MASLIMWQVLLDKIFKRLCVCKIQQSSLEAQFPSESAKYKIVLGKNKMQKNISQGQAISTLASYSLPIRKVACMHTPIACDRHCSGCWLVLNIGFCHYLHINIGCHNPFIEQKYHKGELNIFYHPISLILPILILF